MDISEQIENQSKKHMCFLYGSQKDLLEVVVPFLKEGLLAGAACIWAVPRFIGIEKAKRAMGEAIPDLGTFLEKRQLQLFDGQEVYREGADFDAEETLAKWSAILNDAASLGFQGARISGDASFVSDLSWEEFMSYESKTDALVKKMDGAVLCTYPLKSMDWGRTFDVTTRHEFVFSKSAHDWKILAR